VAFIKDFRGQAMAREDGLSRQEDIEADQ